jgi:hypothetical protein
MATDINVDGKSPGGGGRPPYGYRLVRRIGSGSGAVLEPDPVTAPVVRRIFEQYAAGSGLQVIAEALTADGVLCPSAYDRARNPHLCGVAWSKGAVRAVLVNRRYTSADPEPLIEPELVARVRDSASRKRAGQASAIALADHIYRFRGVLRCHYCSRAMQGTWNNGEPYYRCRFPQRYADANGIAHPRNVYLRERRLLGPLHEWLSSQCGASRLGSLLEAAGAPVESPMHALNELDPAGQADVYQYLHLRLTFRSLDSPVRARIVASDNTVIRGVVAL